MASANTNQIAPQIITLEPLLIGSSCTLRIAHHEGGLNLIACLRAIKCVINWSHDQAVNILFCQEACDWLNAARHEA